MVRWRGLDKINVHKIYNVHFFNSHKAPCLWFMTLPNKKIKYNGHLENHLKKKLMVFFPKIRIDCAFIAQKMQKTSFF